MSAESRKLHLIEAILKVEDEALLNEVEHLLEKGEVKPGEKKKFEDFAGIITDDEAEEWLKNIKEGCEQINPDDWK